MYNHVSKLLSHLFSYYEIKNIVSAQHNQSLIIVMYVQADDLKTYFVPNYQHLCFILQLPVLFYQQPENPML